MSTPKDSARLPARFETLLNKWPDPVRDDRAWEETAETITTRVEMARRPAPGLAQLLEAPLPAEPDEGSLVPRAAMASIPPATEEVDDAWGDEGEEEPPR